MRRSLIPFLLLSAGAGPPPDAAELVNRADVLKVGLEGVALTAVHEVTDTAGKTEKQVYRVLNQVSTGASFIVISSESPDVNGMVYLIKGGVLFAAAPGQRSFVRLGALNLDRRVGGSLFSHWDLQGNLPLVAEYTPAVVGEEAGKAAIELRPRPPGSHYQLITGALDLRSGLFTEMALSDEKGLLKTVVYGDVRTVGSGKTKRRIPTLVTMRRADGRTDLPVPRTTFKISEIELDPAVSYGDELAVSDANLQRLRSRYALSGPELRALLAETER